MSKQIYDCNKSVQLTKNINAKELKCTGKGHIHNTIIYTELTNSVQDFMNKNGLTKVIISSGYRCRERDLAVGGSGKGQHTVGNAMDCCFYKGSYIVSAEDICCWAQDYGFPGIAYIDKNYVHLDTRTSGTYRGDERKGRSNNVPNGDFYAYFNKKKPGGDDTPTDDSAYKTFVKGVQSTCGAKVDGIAGQETLSKTVTLSTKKNSKHKVVKILQTYLIALGYSCGKCGADGIFGSGTKSAVKKFQKANDCVVDGVLDAKNKTWKKLLKLA